jgi:hypothetical protein
METIRLSVAGKTNTCEPTKQKPEVLTFELAWPETVLP